MKCIICGKEIEQSRYGNAVLCSSQCFDENFWNECLDATAIIVNGRCYHDGGKDKASCGFLGFGGAWWRIKKNDGEVIETNNLWYNGEVPKSRNVQDNAVFLKWSDTSD